MYETFKALLKAKNLKVSDVAKGTGIAPSTFTDWKKGTYQPKADKLVKIAEFLGVSYYELAGIKSDTAQPGYSPQIRDFIERLNKLPTEYQKAIYDALKYQEWLYEQAQTKRGSSPSSKEVKNEA